jgi:hypothetical protein
MNDALDIKDFVPVDDRICGGERLGGRWVAGNIFSACSVSLLLFKT